MVHVGLDLSRTRLDVHVMDESGAPLAVTTAVPHAGGLATLAERIAGFGGPVYAAIESMNGARFAHDQLELAGWQVEIADAQKVKGLAPLAAELSAGTWCRRSGCPPRRCAPSGSGPGGGCTWSGTGPR
jgi:transposase